VSVVYQESVENLDQLDNLEHRDLKVELAEMVNGYVNTHQKHNNKIYKYKEDHPSNIFAKIG
jgi:hypothetical protein